MKLYCGKRKIRRFTLIELLAAMSIFSILLLVCMQIFSGARTMWVRSEQKNNAFADGRVAMEYIAARLQTLMYVDEMPFELINSDRVKTDTDEYNYFYKEIWFATAMPMQHKDSAGKEDSCKIRFLKFMRVESGDDAGALKMLIYGSTSSKTETEKFKLLFPPYDDTGYATATTKITNAFSSALSSASGNDSVEIVRNVTSFRLMPYNLSSSEEKIEKRMKQNVSATQSESTPPLVLRMEISLLDTPEHFDDWKNAATDAEKAEIEREFGCTFSRAVILKEFDK